MHSGEAWFDRALLGRTLASLARPREAATPSGDAARIASLTARETEVISLVGQALRNRSIADRLCISEATVRHHLTSIYEKLGVADRLELVVFAYRHKLGEPPE